MLVGLILIYFCLSGHIGGKISIGKLIYWFLQKKKKKEVSIESCTVFILFRKTLEKSSVLISNTQILTMLLFYNIMNVLYLGIIHIDLEKLEIGKRLASLDGTV